ncbi:hypothetical protein YSA_02781 [Pseudomonas putida ND6]|uniref:Uncharacterized protein n=1 Tax=Pseudomonas putida ND6 TaxID=231023 RepID=I3US09_PSEPU|nr:hypothetical protein YSA_02781 [Pseudomonas putida ND6]
MFSGIGRFATHQSADHSQTVFQDVDLNNALNNDRVAA